MSAPFTEKLARYLGPLAKKLDGEDGAVEALIRRHVESSAKAWPGVQVSEEDFLRYVAARLGTDPMGALAGLNAADLYLACACTKGDSKAIEVLEGRFFPEVTEAIARLDDSGELKDEVKQVLRDKLFVGQPGSEPKIADYAGRGPLAGWICAAALKTALSMKRRQKKEVPLEDAPIFDLPSNDPELDFIKASHQKDFRDAFRDAFGALSARERTVLRLHTLDGLNLDEIARLYRTHRSTIARWIQKSRHTLFEKTRALLVERLKLRHSELQSLMRLIQSQLDASIARYLKSRP